MKNILILILLAPLVITATSSFNKTECELNYPSCEDGTSNIVCKRQNKCWSVDGCRSKMLSNSERKLILDTHNELRNRFALGEEPYPLFNGLQVSNMNELQWDSNLEHMRQCWLNTCQNDLDKCKKTNRFFNGTSGIRTLTETNMETKENLKWIVKGEWYETINQSTSDVLEIINSNDNVPKEMLFDYIIAGDYTHIGCARSLNSYNEYLFSCLYGPKISENTQLLKWGPSCSECPEGRKCSKKYPGLCALEDKKKDNDNKHNFNIFNIYINNK